MKAAELEKDLITKALEETGGNVTRAAKLLQISRKSLQTKMKEFGLRDTTPQTGGKKRSTSDTRDGEISPRNRRFGPRHNPFPLWEPECGRLFPPSDHSRRKAL